jgi:hypothetical protein
MIQNMIRCGRGTGMDWMTTKEAGELWGIKIRRVHSLCGNGKIDGATRLVRDWIIPKGTFKPIDWLTKAAKQAKTDRQ